MKPEQRPDRFFVDEGSFKLPLEFTATDLQKHLEVFVDLVRTLHKAGDEVFRWSKLEETIIQPGILLCDLLYQANAVFPIDKELRVALQQVINRCVHWDECLEPYEPISDLHVEINGQKCETPTVAFVFSRIQIGIGSACLALGACPERSELATVQTGSISHKTHFISKTLQLPGFFRTLFDFEDMDSDAYMENVSDAFPELAFVPGLSSQFSNFKTRYRNVRPIVTDHLAALNDRFAAIFMKHNGQPSKVSQEFGAACGIDASPESPKTHSNKKAMRERDVVIDIVRVGRRSLQVGHTVACEWHTKISPTADRIHFHPGLGGQSKSVGEFAEGRVIVGKFAEHLNV